MVGKDVYDELLACGPHDLFDQLLSWRQMPAVYQDDLTRQLRALTYPDFLHTVYWREVKRAVIYFAGGRCRFCNQAGWQVHHLSYEHHGAEHRHLADLILLCGECHVDTHQLPNKWQRGVMAALQQLTGEHSCPR